MFDNLRTFVRAERKKKKKWIHSFEMAKSTFKFDRILFLTTRQKFKTKMVSNEVELVETLESNYSYTRKETIFIAKI